VRCAALAVLAVGCGSTTDVVGPFTGATHRYALYRIELPQSLTDATKWGGDLDGDGVVQNQIGLVLNTLQGVAISNVHATELIAAGTIATSLQITADDLHDDPTVGVRYLGTPDSTSLEVGGQLEDGWFRSNRTATTAVPGEAQFHLPVFADADPSLVTAIGMELMLVPYGTDGFRADVHAAIPTDSALWGAVHRGLSQMVASAPGNHRVMLALLDNNRDHEISLEEVRGNSILISLLSPDVTISGRAAISIGFRAYFRPCETGQCQDAAAPFDRCFDRQLDSDETDIDCGGSCHDCQAGAACTSVNDCATIACVQGRCGPPSCTDNVLDGLETSVDCGGGDCPGCPTGKRCFIYSDCTSGNCGGHTSGGAWDDYHEASCL